ncbi:MAG TPA: AIR synthase-related protein, partial [Chloroflexota bacterium]|nr:AIR synthase-related protein [Chloroflexota bacterium]
YLEPMKRLMGEGGEAPPQGDERRLKPAATGTTELPLPLGEGRGEVSGRIGGFVDVRGMAHITGGGIPGNVSRVIPSDLKAVFRWGSWPVLPIFSLIQQRGRIPVEEMLRVFNLGLGFVFVCPPEDEAAVRRLAPEAMLVGEVMASDSEERVAVEGV